MSTARGTLCRLIVCSVVAEVKTPHTKHGTTVQIASQTLFIRVITLFDGPQNRAGSIPNNLLLLQRFTFKIPCPQTILCYWGAQVNPFPFTMQATPFAQLGAYWYWNVYFFGMSTSTVRYATPLPAEMKPSGPELH